MKTSETGGPIFQLKVTLRGSKPPIWRRFLVPGGITLKQLHGCLQAVMGWTDSHLHEFEAKGVRYGPPDRELEDTRISEARTRVDQVLRRPKDRLRYEYDFGDGWTHDVVLEAVLPPGYKGRYPAIMAGKRACPPEDVGGLHGYHHFLQAIADPQHPEHDDMLDWMDGTFDPEAFDVRAANLAIHGDRFFAAE